MHITPTPHLFSCKLCFISFAEGDPYSSFHVSQDAGSRTTDLYLDARDLPTLELLYVKILSEFSEVTLVFNTARLLIEGRLDLAPVRLWNEGPSPQAVIFKEGVSATVTTSIDTNIDKLTTFVNFIGINTTEKPHRLHDLQATDMRITSNLINTTSGFRWSVSLDPSLVDIGGLLSLRVVEQLFNGPVLQVHVGKTVYIIPDKPGEPRAPFPPGSLALLSLYKYTEQVIETKPPIGAIWCYAFGNPAPHTNLVRLLPGGRREELPGRVYNIGQYDTARVHILSNVSRAHEGRYMCEARAGNSVATEPIIVRHQRIRRVPEI